MIKSNKKNSNVPITKKHYKKFNVMLDKGGVLGQITVLKTVVTWILGTQTFPNDCLSSSFTVSLFDHCVVLHRFVPPAPQLQTVEEDREKDRLTTQLFCYVVLFLTRYPYCFLAKALRIRDSWNLFTQSSRRGYYLWKILQHVFVLWVYQALPLALCW